MTVSVIADKGELVIINLSKMSPNQYTIVNEATGLVLDVNSSGDNVIMWSAHGGNNERFTLDGPFIRAVHSGKVLDVSRQDGSILQWEAHGLENQRWEFHPDGTIRLEGSDLCMDVEGGNEEEGARVIAWPFHGGANQVIEVRRVAHPAPTQPFVTLLYGLSMSRHRSMRASSILVAQGFEMIQLATPSCFLLLSFYHFIE